MTVKQGVEDVATGNSLIQNPEKCGPDITRDTGVPGRVEPKCSPPPNSALVITPPLPISVVQCVNVDLFILQFVCVTAGLERILIQWLCFIKYLFITGQNIQTVVDILGDILQDGWWVV